MLVSLFKRLKCIAWNRPSFWTDTCQNYMLIIVSTHCEGIKYIHVYHPSGFQCSIILDTCFVPVNVFVANLK